jgi:hypothetical protein
MVVASLLAGCSSAADDSATTTSASLEDVAVAVPVLPAPGGHGALSPWGGADASHWRPEAIIANAASRALNDAWHGADAASVKDVVVAMPVKMLSSDDFEFGDGQSNAAPQFPSWTESRPQVVGTLVRTTLAGGNEIGSRIVLRFDRALPFATPSFEIAWSEGSARKSATVDGARDASGDAIATWTPPASLLPAFDDRFSGRAVLVRPVGWNDWFPLWFRMPVKPIDDVRASHARYADGRGIVDREHISSRNAVNAGDGKTPYERVANHEFSAGYNNRPAGFVAPYVSNDVHAVFPYERQRLVTGVGRGFTWVANEQPGGFKDMITCFDARNTAAEASAPNGGVASGGGWHQIGDVQETILNDLEAAPLAVGSAMRNAWLGARDDGSPLAAIPSGQIAYGNTDVVTIRFLMPGEAFITPAGGTGVDADGTSYDQANFHWFFFSSDKEVCSEEIVTLAGQPLTGFDP